MSDQQPPQQAPYDQHDTAPYGQPQPPHDYGQQPPYAPQQSQYAQQPYASQQPYAPQPPYAPQQPPYAQQPPYYGAPGGAYAPTPYTYPGERPWNSMAIVGLILAFVVPPAGLVLGAIALSQIGRSGERGRGLSIAGIVIGALGTAFIVISVAFAFWALGDAAQYMNDYYGNYDYYDAGLTPQDAQDMLGQFTGYIATLLPLR